MVLLQNNKLVQIDTREDSYSTVTAVKSLEALKKDNPISYHDKPVEYTLTYNKGSNTYLFKMTKSPFKDDSEIGNGYNGHYFTKGYAILAMINAGFRVYQDEVEVILPVK